MSSAKTRLRFLLKWILWVVLAQLVLVNISAAIYAYRFTHYYNGPPPPQGGDNVFTTTWKLFTGPRFYKMTAEEEPSFPYRTVRLKLDQHEIDTWYSTVDKPKGCVVLFHGATTNKSFLKTEAACFRNWGYNVLLVDFRGHGRSSGNNGSFGWKECEEAEAAVRYAGQQGNKKVILYGLSLGAVVSLRAAAQGRIEPAAIIADLPFYSLRSHLQGRAAELGFPSEPFASLVTLWMGWERGYNGYQHEMGKLAEGIRCPVLLQWGAADPFITKEQRQALFDRLGSTPKKIVTYEGAGHESLLYADPGRWQTEVERFLSSLP